MPENANPHAQSAKKRKTSESGLPRDVCDSSFASAYRDSSEELQLRQQQRHEHQTSDGKDALEVKLPGPIRDLQRNQAEEFSLKCRPSEKSLKEHMESILSEVKEAREKLLHWWSKEMQAILSTTAQRRGSHKDAGTRKEPVDCSASRGPTASVQAMPNEGQACEGQDPGKIERGKLQIANDTNKDYQHDSTGFDKKSCELLSPDPKPTVIDAAIDSGRGAASKTVNEPDQGLPGNSKSDKAELKVDVPAPNAMNKLPVESKSALFDMCFGAELGDDVKDVEGLDGTLESGVTMREGFEFSKANHDIQKGLDRLDRLRETKSALLDMGFDDEESNEGNGVGCSLESAASSKVNSGFSKVTVGMQNNFNKGFDAGFAAAFGGKGKEHSGLTCGPEGAASSADVYGSGKVKKEVLSDERKHAAVKEGPVNSTRGGRLDDDSRQVDRAIGLKSGQASLKSSHMMGGSLSQISQPKDVQQQVGVGSRPACGIKRSYSTAMTFKGSALDSKNDVYQQGNHSYADVFNSATSSILVLKDSVQLSTGDKGKGETLALPSEGDTLGMSGGASPSWNMFAVSKNAISHTLQQDSKVALSHALQQDSKVAHLEYASRSKLGDAVLGSGRAVDFPGFDPVPGYASHFKAGAEIMDAYQQERPNANSMYFSSLCTNNSVYLPTSNRVMSVQRSPPSTSPASTSGLRPMLMGMPGHVGGHHDPSNMHTFLGLGMNGVPAAVANGVQMFPGLYLQNNQQQNHQASFKNTPQSTSSMVSQQESSAAQEKAILELNF